MTLDEATTGARLRVTDLGGKRAFRRRLMEFGLLPGTEIELIRVAPLGDPLELRLRGCHLSIRKAEARHVTVDDA